MNFLYFNMVCRVTIGRVQFEYVKSITINESIKRLSDTATIVIPTQYKLINKEKYKSLIDENILDFIKVGNKVTIELGYNGNLETEFKGYVTSISADVPIRIKCEDEMFNLRKNNFSQAFRSLTLKQLAKVIAPNYKHNLIDNISLGKFTMNNETAYQILERLRKDYGLHSRFENEVFTIGFPVSFKPQTTHKLHLNRNVRAQQNDLKYVRKDDIKLLIKAISIQRNGKRIVSEFGDKAGAVRTLHFMDKTLDELKELAEKNYKSLNFDGYQGSIPTWGLPRTKAGNTVHIIAPKLNEKEDTEKSGKYLIEEVTQKFNSTDGYLRINKLSLKL